MRSHDAQFRQTFHAIYLKSTLENRMQTTQTNQTINTSFDDFGKLILRVALALLLLFHGISKMIGGVGFVSGMLAKAGLPAGLGYLVYIGEVIAPLMILFGVWTKAAAAVVAINMIVAVLLVHTAQFFTLSQTGGWALELQGLYFIGAVVVALQGAGRYSVGGETGRWN
jgi:putative oxidoreductase